jgi:hypothetical protein
MARCVGSSDVGALAKPLFRVLREVLVERLVKVLENRRRAVPTSGHTRSEVG